MRKLVDVFFTIAVVLFVLFAISVVPWANAVLLGKVWSPTVQSFWYWERIVTGVGVVLGLIAGTLFAFVSAPLVRPSSSHAPLSRFSSIRHY